MEDEQMKGYSPIPLSPGFPGNISYQTGFTPEISELSGRRHIYDVCISMQGSDGRCAEELIEAVEMENIISDDLLDLQRLLRFLRVEANMHIKDHQILLYLIVGELYVNFGVFPFLSARQVQLDDFLHERLIRLKLVAFPHSLLHLEMLNDHSDLLVNGLPTLLPAAPRKDDGATIKQPKPICVKNFQKIGYIVKKVISMKTNADCPEGQFLNDRQLSAKSLQDYYYNIKLGFRYKFDFNAHSTKNMRYLRKFVKEHLKKDTVRKRRRSTRAESVTEAGPVEGAG